MSVTIQQFREAWTDKENRDPAVAIAQQYVDENMAILEPMLNGKSSDDCVKLIDLARASNNADLDTMITMWELVKFPRKNIEGAVLSRAPRKGKGE